MSSRIQQVAYGLSAPGINVPFLPVVALAAPSTAILGYQLGQIWIVKSTGAAYMLVSTAGAVSTWIQVAVASGASFTTLTSTGQFTLDTTTAAANTLGNTTGTTSISSYVGTGGYLVDGVPSSAYSFGASTTTGTMVLGGTAQTGAITLGSSSGTNIVNVGTGAGATTVNIASGVTNAKAVNIGTGAAMANNIAIGGTGANVIIIGDVQTGGAISLGAAMTTGTLNLGSIVAGTGIITLGGGTGAQALNIAANTGVKTITVGGTSANVIAIGNTQTAGSISLGAAMTTGTINIGSATSGLVTMPFVSVTAAGLTVVNNVRVGQAIYTGNTTGALAGITLVLTNSLISATSSIFVTVSNLGANDAQMTLTRVLPGAGTCTIQCINNGAAALNGDIQVSFWVN